MELSGWFIAIKIGQNARTTMRILYWMRTRWRISLDTSELASWKRARFRSAHTSCCPCKTVAPATQTNIVFRKALKQAMR